MGTCPAVTFEGQWERATSLPRSYLLKRGQENNTAKQQPRQEHQLVPSYHTPTCGEFAVSHEDEKKRREAHSRDSLRLSGARQGP